LDDVKSEVVYAENAKAT